MTSLQTLASRRSSALAITTLGQTTADYRGGSCERTRVAWVTRPPTNSARPINNDLRTGRWCGFFVLNHAGDQAGGVKADEVSVGWWITRSFWGRGLAGEGARAILKEVFDTLTFERLIALIAPMNTRSVRVAESSG